MKPHKLIINDKKKDVFWKKKLQDFELYVKRSNKILINLKSKEQLLQIPSIHNKLINVFPSGTILKDINLIEKFLQISNSIRENYFFIEVRDLGRHLINSLMYLHGIAQTYYAIQWYHYFTYLFNKKKYSKLELIEVRRLTRLLLHFDFILLSSIEYLLKNFKDFFIEEVEQVENSKEVSYRIIKFINEYATYFNEIHSLNLFKLNIRIEIDLVFGPGIYYFRFPIQQQEFLEYAKLKSELFSSDDKDYFQKSLNSYETLKQDFSALEDFWYDKFGYRIESIISTAQILQHQLIERYSPFLERYEHNIPVFNIPDLENKTIIDIRRIFESYLYELISNYLTREELFNTFWTLKDITNIIKGHRSDWKSNEIKNILTELRADPSEEFHLGENKLANRLFYPLDRFSLFFYIIEYPGALRERFYNQSSKLDNSSKEFILINHIRRILKENNFKIHPLSGRQFINEKGKTLGELDIIATKSKDILLFIESKIMLQKKIDISKIRNFNQHMKNIMKEIKKFDRNIGNFSNYCGNSRTLKHFLNYPENDILLINDYTIKKYYFITPYLIFPADGLITKHAIESLSIYLFEDRLKFLLKPVEAKNNNEIK